MPRLKEIDKRVGTVDQITILAAATVIDPRFKKMYFTNPIYCAKAVEFINNMTKKHICLFLVGNGRFYKKYSLFSSKAVSLWGEHKLLIAGNVMDVEAGGINTAIENSQVEMTYYLRQPIIWWQQNCLKYPNLQIYPKALKLLSVLGTSVPSERLFSKAGETIPQKRSSLQGKRLSKLLFLQCIHSKF